MKFVCGILTVTGYRDYTCCYMGPQPFFFVGIKTYCDQQIRPQNSCTAFVNNPDETPVDAGIDCRRTGTSGYFSPNGLFAFVCDHHVAAILSTARFGCESSMPVQNRSVAAVLSTVRFGCESSMPVQKPPCCQHPFWNEFVCGLRKSTTRDENYCTAMYRSQLS